MDVTFLLSKPHGTIPLKNSRSQLTFNAKPCIVTHRLTFTPIAHIFLSDVLPTSNQTPVLLGLFDECIFKSFKVFITANSKNLKYLCMSVKKFSKSRIG